MAQDDERARRLAAALRENLRKRKAQARAATTDDSGQRDAQPATPPRPPGD